MTSTNRDTDYLALNASLNLYDANNQIQFDKDKQAVRQYFLNHVNENTVFFHSLEEKLNFLVEEEYYEREFLEAYDFAFIKKLFQQIYAHKFRFQTFVSAYKYYTSYTLRTFDGKRYLERYEDRIAITALYLARGDKKLAEQLAEEMITNRYQPATPTFLNSGKKHRGEGISCYLIRVEDNMESIARSITSSLQLSKRGGGVALLLTNVREAGAPIKKIEGQSSGVIPVMKMLEDAFSYANQLGARQGAGAVYLHAHHPDILEFLDTRRENADEKIRIKTLSLGVVIPDITFELAKNDEYMYLFSPYDVKRIYGKDLSDISVTDNYRDMVDNKEIRKKKIKAREFLQTLAELQIQSGYPYILFEDTATRANPLQGRINMSNLCSEILQTNEASTYSDDTVYTHVGKDIACNLGSLNIARVMNHGEIDKTVEVAIRALTSVAETTPISTVPSIDKGNKDTRAIGLGQMNLHGYLASERIHYGSEEGIDFTNIYFYTIAYHAVKSSNKLAKEKGEYFVGFETSKYASGEYFEKYINEKWEPKTKKVAKLFEKAGIEIPTQEDWEKLARSVKKYGIYNAYLQAVPPTGSISYVNFSTSSIHPVTDKIQIRKEGTLGRVYYPAYGMTNDNLEYYEDAYSIGFEKLIDTYAAATQHVDQGLSCTLFFKEGVSTRVLNQAQIYAWRKGVKTIYYTRLRQIALEGTEQEGCVSCAL